jgi:L-threonylcarbamoyladenylate synthase
VIKTEQLLIQQRGAPLLAAQAIRQGELVVFPTDTVYGIGADPFSESAIDRLYEAKKRPDEKGIPILVGDIKDVAKVVRGGLAEMPTFVHTLMQQFWPGPLTLILPKASHLPPNLTPNDKIAVRLLDHDLSRAFIRLCGGAVATSSANLSGTPPARAAAQTMLAFRGKVSVILDGGLSPDIVPSTIVDCTVYPPTVVRVGVLAPETIQQAIDVSLKEMPA